MLRTHDETERDFWEAVRKEASEVVDNLMTNLARKIVNEYAEARNKGKKKSGG